MSKFCYTTSINDIKGTNVKYFLLTKIRLSWYLMFFLFVYTILAFTLPRVTFESGALTLFSVNSFLYGFYIAPILSGQKSRIEEMHRIVRNETNALFAIMLDLRKLPDETRKPLKKLFEQYITLRLVNGEMIKGGKKYEEIISFCMDEKNNKKGVLDSILDKVVANQQNRTLINMQSSNGVFSNEWIIMMVLFSITLGFVLFLDTGEQAIFNIVTAFLCTGLTMLVIVLAKLSTLTHKKARQIWLPPKKLLETHFYRFD